MTPLNPPRTPPRRSYNDSQLLTPPTPRFAPMDEPDFVPGKQNSLPLPRPSTAASVLPITPEQTPLRKNRQPRSLLDVPPVSLRGPPPSATSTGQSHSAVPPKIAPMKTPRPKMEIYHEPSPKPSAHSLPHRKPFSQRMYDSDDVFSQPSGSAFDTAAEKGIEATTERHPYDKPDLNVPGMWHVFRGKRVFRPFASGVSPLSDYKPRVLFGPKRDGASLEMSCSPISDHKVTGKGLENMDDPFMSRMTKPSRIDRPSTPELDSESETDREDDAPQQLRIQRAKRPLNRSSAQNPFR